MKWISVSEKLPELTIHENEPFIGEWDNSEPVLVYHSDDKWECKYLVAQYTNGFADVGEPILYGWVDINDGEEVKGVLAWMPLPQPYTADRKTESNSEKPNNCEVKNYCDDCLYTDTCDSKAFFYACTSKATISKMEQVDKDINVRSKDEPTTQKETQNSNLTFEKQTDCYMCKWLGEVDVCGRCRNRNLFAEADTEPKPKDEPQTDCAWK